MRRLTLVRHGQASFGADDYDRLSPLGERQGTLLGAHWQRCGFEAGAVFSGALRRQRVTAERALSALGADPASLSVDPAFDEYEHQGLIRAYLPVLAREHPELATKLPDLSGDRHRFQQVFKLVITAWMQARAPEAPIAETWSAFRSRCLDGVLAAAEHHERTLVFTSGGVITATLQHALGVSDEVARRLNWRIFNASVHVFELGRNGLALIGYNDVAHLQTEPDQSLLTYR